MKLTRNGIEGSDVEITNFFKNNGFDAAQYLNPSALQIPRYRWIVLPTIGFLTTVISLCFNSHYLFLTIPLVITALILGFWVVVTLHLRFRNWFVNSIALLFLILIIGLSAKAYTINQVLDRLLTAQKNLKTDE